MTLAILLGAELDEFLGLVFLAEQLADDAHARLGVFHRLFAEVDIDQRDADLAEFFDIASFFRRGLGIDIHDDDVGLQRDRLLDVECAVLHAAKGRQLGDVRDISRDRPRSFRDRPSCKSSRQPTIRLNGSSRSSAATK